MRVLIVSSVGGHLTEVMLLEPLLADHKVSLVVNDQALLPDFPFERVYQIRHAERGLGVLANFAEAAAILQAERPELLLSTGAGPVVPFAWLARLTGGTRIVYVESAAAVTRPTITGRLMRRVAHDFFYQWATLGAHFPRGRHVNIAFP